MKVVRERVKLVMRQLPLLHKLNGVYPLGLKGFAKGGLRIYLALDVLSLSITLHPSCRCFHVFD